MCSNNIHSSRSESCIKIHQTPHLPIMQAVQMYRTSLVTAFNNYLAKKDLNFYSY